MNFKKPLILIFLLLAGCETKPLLLEKEISYPSQTRSHLKYVNKVADLRQCPWWKKLHDRRLDALIHQAILQNNEIRSAAATILQAEAQLKSAQFAWLPTLDASSRGFVLNTWDTSVKPQGPLVNTPLFSNLSNIKIRSYYAGFVPSYTVNIMNNIYNVKSARASLANKCAEIQATKLAIISQMANAYFMLLSQRTQLQLEHSLVKDLQELHRLEETRYRDGANDIERVLDLEQQLAEEKMKIPQIEDVIAQTENAIRVLINQNPGPIATSKNLLSINTQALVPKNLPASVLHNRPDIMMGVSSLKMASAQVGVAYAAFFPTFSLSNTTGRSSVNLVHLLKLSTAFWLTEAQATTKLINGSAYQNIKAAKAQYFSTYYNYLQTLRQAFADVDNALTSQQKTRIAYLQAKNAYTAAQKSLGLSRDQYQAGSKDYRDVVNAKVNAKRFALTLVEEKAQLLNAIVQIYTAVAAGARTC